MLKIYCDGACQVHKGGKAGWAVVMSNGVEIGGYLTKSTSNRAELTAVLMAIEWCIAHNEKGVIYSDSTYVVKGLNQWCKKWSRNGWTSKGSLKNKDIWEYLYPRFLKSGCSVKWVKGHNGNWGNEKADRLAGECMVTQKRFYKGLDNEENV